MKRLVAYGFGAYGVFCAVNWALAYNAARTGNPLLFGSAALMNLNETLRKFNIVSHLFDPLAAAQRAGAGTPAPAGAAYLPAPPAQVTQQPAGSTTYFGP
jgi:hypothetical protein